MKIIYDLGPKKKYNEALLNQPKAEKTTRIILGIDILLHS